MTNFSPGQDPTKILSSLPLQIFIYFNRWYALFFFSMNIALFSWKGYTFYYPPQALAWEITMLFLLALLESCRLFLVSKGNKTEQLSPLLYAASLSIPVCVAYAYYLSLQIYVLQLDVILSTVGLIFVGLEFFLSLFTGYQFYSAYRG